MSFFEFPNTRTYDKDLGWVIAAMEALKNAMETFIATNSLTFADPLLYDLTTAYNKNTIVLDPNGNAYLSLKQVPAGIGLSNTEYWLMIFDYEAFLEKVNKNFTGRYYRNTNRATSAMSVGDWLTFDDVLCKVTANIAVDELIEVGVNIQHFTLEDFIKQFTTNITNLVNQYKNDIDASELAYQAAMQAEVDRILAGATVDSEVIDARYGADGVNYPTLGQAIRTQFTDVKDAVIDNDIAIILSYQLGYVKSSDGTISSSTTNYYSEMVPVEPGERYHIKGAVPSAILAIAGYETSSSSTAVVSKSFPGSSGAIDSDFTIPEGINFIRLCYNGSNGKTSLYNKTTLTQLDNLQTDYNNVLAKINTISLNDFFTAGFDISGTTAEEISTANVIKLFTGDILEVAYKKPLGSDNIRIRVYTYANQYDRSYTDRNTYYIRHQDTNPFIKITLPTDTYYRFEISLLHNNTATGAMQLLSSIDVNIKTIHNFVNDRIVAVRRVSGGENDNISQNITGKGSDFIHVHPGDVIHFTGTIAGIPASNNIRGVAAFNYKNVTGFKEWLIANYLDGITTDTATDYNNETVTITGDTSYIQASYEKNKISSLYIERIYDFEYKKRLTSDELVHTAWCKVTNAGDCIIYKTPDNKVLMIDTNYDNQWRFVSAAMAQLNVQHIDYFVVSHYHGDHVGNVPTLVTEGYIDEDTIIFLPYDVDTDVVTDTGVLDNYNTIEPLLRGLGGTVIQPIEWEHFDLGYLSLDFFNTDHSYYYSHWSDVGSNYNVCSLCCYITINDTVICSPGDFERPEVLETYADKLWKCNIYKANHHSAWTQYSEKWMRALYPEIMITTLGRDIIYGAQRNAFADNDNVVHMWCEANMVPDYITGLMDDNLYLDIGSGGYRFITPCRAIKKSVEGIGT